MWTFAAKLDLYLILEDSDSYDIEMAGCDFVHICIYRQNHGIDKSYNT